MLTAASFIVCAGNTYYATASSLTTSKVRAELEELQQAAVAERAEKDEMCRLHNELLKQLRTAEEEKEELQVWGMREFHSSLV